MKFHTAIITAILFLLTSWKLQAQWNSLGNGTPSSIESLYEYNGKLILGSTGPIGGVCYGMATWGGTIWDSLGVGTSYGEVKCFAEYNGELIAAGSFLKMGTNISNSIPNTRFIAAWNGTQWHALGSGGGSSNIGLYAIAVYNGELYVGGNFTNFGGITSSRIARWNGSTWNTVGGGITGGTSAVYSMCVFDGQLYVGGDFQMAGGIQVNGLARWNGIQWDSVGSGVYGWPWEMLVDTIHNHLIIGGNFACSDTSMGIGICAWNGTSFLPFGYGLKYVCSTIAFYNGYLFANSPFQPGMVQDTILVYWDSTSWKPAAIANSNIAALASYNNELYAGGYFDTIGGQAIPYVARYYNPSLGIPEPSLENKKLKIFPNPSTETVTISFSFANGAAESKLRIYNISGKLMLSKKVNESISTFTIDAGFLPKGIYLVTVQNRKIKLTEKFVVE